MKVLLDEIPETGTLDVSFREEEALLNSFLADRWAEDFRFEAPVKGSFKCARRGSVVTVDYILEGSVLVRCSSCLSEFGQDISCSGRATLFPEDEEDGGQEIHLKSEDVEKDFYRNGRIDLGEVMREEILLLLPYSPRCSGSCKGLCPSCGRNLNEGDCACSTGQKENPFSVLKNLKIDN